MIFINYRHEDASAVVTHLNRRLADRYGEALVFVDYGGIPISERWDLKILQKLKQARVLLVVVGSAWGSVRFATGKKANKLRLEDPDDWVRLEICTALRLGADVIRTIVIKIDDAELPETEWDCELDQLHRLQHARLHNLGSFEQDFQVLVASLEQQVPELMSAAARQSKALINLAPPPVPSNSLLPALRQYLTTELTHHATLQLPLISANGQPVVVPLNQLRIDLPLVIAHKHVARDLKAALLWLGVDISVIHGQFRLTHTNALQVDRAARFEDIPRDCSIADCLRPGCRLVVVGDPGCGKSTLLQWVAHCYTAQYALAQQLLDGFAEPPLPAHGWLPITVLCRELIGKPMPGCIEDLLRMHLHQRQFSDAIIGQLLPHFEHLLEQGQVILLLDGLDELPGVAQRIAFCELLNAISNRFPQAAMVVTSRVVGFQAVREVLAGRFDHVLVGPLDHAAKKTFITHWSALIGWTGVKAENLLQQVCYRRVLAKLTDNIFLLAMVAQIQVFDQYLPVRRIDIYRRAVELMILRCRAFPGPPLSLNELLPHLAFLAYWMRRQGVQRCSEAEVVRAFNEVRRLEPNEGVLQTRPPEVLMQACIEAVGLLNVAGTETDERGFDRIVIQFFHQSFQEYFAGQALKYGHDGQSAEVGVGRLRDLLAGIQVCEQEVVICGRYTISEPIMAGDWQESVRFAVAALPPSMADDAILMLLPGPATAPAEARARAVFALQCLAEEPQVSEMTVLAVCDAVIDAVAEGDGVSSKQNTRMDEAIAAVAELNFGKVLGKRLLDAFIHGRGEPRLFAGCCYIFGFGYDVLLEALDMDGAITRINQLLTSPQQEVRVSAALALMEIAYKDGGKMGFLLPQQRSDLLAGLLAAMGMDEATACAGMWALSWLTGARNRLRGNWLGNSVGNSEGNLARVIDEDEFVLLNASMAGQIEQLLRQKEGDCNTLANGCLVLTRVLGLDIVVHQFDWVYALAEIADGAWPRQNLPKPRPSGRMAETDWMKDWLTADLPVRYLARIAISLGAFGVFVPEMVPALGALLFNPAYLEDDRDEAMLYLGLIGALEAARILTEAADTAPDEDGTFLYERGLLGLLLLDDVDVLSEQICKALPHSDLAAYAYGLAGSANPRGRVLLQMLKKHESERVRDAVNKALAVSWFKDIKDY